MANNTTQRRTAAYLRVSTAGQADSGLGLDAQRAKVDALATLHDLTIDATHVDAGVSGSTLDRPALAALLADVRAGKVGVVLVAKLDRLTRSVADLAELIDVLNKRDVRLVSAGESIDTGTAAGRLVLSVLGAVSQWEREAIAERTAAALGAKRARGERAGNVPFGFSADESGRLHSHDGERRTIGRARALQGEGLSLRAIGRVLTAEGHRTRRGRPFTAEGLRRSVLTAAEVA